jgi:predicted O-methyltransferase YrrM
MTAAAVAAARPRPAALAWRPHRLEKIADRLRYRSWFAAKDFTSDWTSGNFTMWRRVLSPLRQEPLRILEIGSWEGRSATFFLNFFPRSTIVCVDTFGGSEEERSVYRHLAAQVAGIEARFDRNLAPFGNRVEKIKSHSTSALERLTAQNRRFDLAYIDGGHRRDDVMADSRGVWRLLAPGGVVIWDDYEWGRGLPPEERPQPAIDDFLREHEGRYRLLGRTYQLAIERLE